eukprot:6770-Eustigmatos_ZCMA.PRE.1
MGHRAHIRLSNALACTTPSPQWVCRARVDTERNLYRRAGAEEDTQGVLAAGRPRGKSSDVAVDHRAAPGHVRHRRQWCVGP